MRNLTHRFAEHKGKSVRTGRPLSHPSHSAIRDHSLHADHPFTIADFGILSTVRSPKDTKLLESIYIKHFSPSLNNQASSYPLQILKWDFPSEASGQIELDFPFIAFNVVTLVRPSPVCRLDLFSLFLVWMNYFSFRLDVCNCVLPYLSKCF